MNDFDEIDLEEVERPKRPRGKTKQCKYCKEQIREKAKICPYCRKKQNGGCIKYVLIALAIFIFVPYAVGSCANNGSGETSQKVNSNSEKIYVSENEINNIFANANDYKGKYVKLAGKVFASPEVGNGKTTIQMFCDPENGNQNVYIIFKTNTCDIQNGDYILVDGLIKGDETGRNLFGGVVTALKIESDSIEKSNYIDVMSPTIKELIVNQSQEQYGYSISIDKIEYAEKETRLYITVTNNGNSKFNFYSFNAKIIQNGKQYEQQMNYYADYEEVQSNLLPGTNSSGIISFPALDATMQLQIYCDGNSDSWDEEIKDYVFEISNE